MTKPDKTASLNDILRSLPSVDEVLGSDELAALAADLPHASLADAARRALDAARRALRAGEDIPADLRSVALRAQGIARGMLTPSLRRVVNASGVVIHTNLGRSVLAESAVEAVVDAARGYSTLEYDVDNMRRGSRHAHCENLICSLTGAEAAIAVNNNAAAVMMVLSEFAAGRKAIVSRGELVEIGGSFRIPDIMELSNAQMIEVGTTNKTHVWDYERALDDDVAMLLKVHTSNYRLIGFTETVSGRDLRRVADEALSERKARGVHAPGLLVYEDLGSGAFVQVEHGVENPEPTVREALGAGCDLVSFSGDKLLGGPQAGIIVGSKELIDRLKKNPLARALRLDKMTLAALEATLRLYLDPERARAEIPTLRMLDAPADEMRRQAESLASKITSALPDGCLSADVVPEISRAGGGALPMRDIPTFVVQVDFLRGDAQSCDEHLVKGGDLPVVARLKQEKILFDPRTMLAGEDDEVVSALAAYFAALDEAQTPPAR